MCVPGWCAHVLLILKNVVVRWYIYIASKRSRPNSVPRWFHLLHIWSPNFYLLTPDIFESWRICREDCGTCEDLNVVVYIDYTRNLLLGRRWPVYGKIKKIRLSYLCMVVNCHCLLGLFIKENSKLIKFSFTSG